MAFQRMAIAPYPITPPIKYGGKSIHVNVVPSNAAPSLVDRNCVSQWGCQSCRNSSPHVARVTAIEIVIRFRGRG